MIVTTNRDLTLFFFLFVQTGGGGVLCSLSSTRILPESQWILLGLQFGAGDWEDHICLCAWVPSHRVKAGEQMPDLKSPMTVSLGPSFSLLPSWRALQEHWAGAALRVHRKP